MKSILVINDEEQTESGIDGLLDSDRYAIHSSYGENDGFLIADRYPPDIIILNLSSAAETLNAIKNICREPDLLHIPLIPVTSEADHDYLQELFDCGADGFLKRPVSREKLESAVSLRLKKIAALGKHVRDREIEPFSDAQQKSNRDDHILVNIGSRLKFIKFNDILCITAQKEYSLIHVENGRNILVRRSLKTWREMLPPRLFLQIHRATIINIERIKKIRRVRDRSYAVTLHGIDTEFPLSYRYANIMRRTFPRM